MPFPTFQIIRPPLRLIFILPLLLSLQIPPIATSGEDIPKNNTVFESHIRPILTEHCISCHNPARHKGGLDLTRRWSAIKGGDSGPAIDTSQPGQSLLLSVIDYTTEIQMPPKGKLKPQDINTLTQWIKAGSPWPESAVLIAPQTEPASTSAEHVGPKLRAKPFQLTPEDKAWWAFGPIKKPVLATTSPGEPVTNDLDQLLLNRLRARQLQFSPQASRRELIRRAYYDILGLPPSPEAVIAFEADQRPNAWETLVDELLARPQYGERWGRHWLDLVRFAETNGYERDGEKPNAWRYRDYVINSFNQDKPYDQFLAEQLAGDEMPGPFQADRIIATGYYRLHVWDDEPDSTVAAEFDDLDDMMVTTGASMLGLTLGCARCHDHKFDPISQADYYRFLATFRSVNPYGQHKTGGGGRGTGRIARPLATETEVAKWNEQKTLNLNRLRDELKAAKTEADRNAIQDRVKRLKTDADAPFGQALAITEDPIKPTFILRRGEASSPTAEVQPATPDILGPGLPVIVPPTHQPSSGRRLALARWITAKENPLTARVLVNRLWQHHFGRGLVPTPNDFGRTGELPTHPELLDYLAADFISNGFKIKRMHKLIMMSQAYRMSSRADRPNAIRADEPNHFFWRQNPTRIEAEALRDSLLAFSDSLNLKQGGPGIFPALPEEVYRSQDSARRGWPESSPDEQNRRSVYIFVKRALVPPILETFDCPSTTVPVGSRAVTTVAPQALLLLNDGFVRKQAEKLSERVRKEAGQEPASQVGRAFSIVLQRKPSQTEMQLALDFLHSPSRKNTTANQALADFCLALLNLNEVIYVD